MSMAVEGPPPPSVNKKAGGVGSSGGPGMARGVGRGSLPPPPSMGGMPPPMMGGAPMGLGAAPGEFFCEIVLCLCVLIAAVWVF